MKKEDFFAEVARIYFATQAYLGLFPYVKMGNCPEAVNNQLKIIRLFDKDEFLQGINAENIQQDWNKVLLYIGKKLEGLAHEFAVLDFVSSEPENMQLWMESFEILCIFTDERFLQQTVEFFIKHKNCFDGTQYWRILSLLAKKNMTDIMSYLSQQVKISYKAHSNLIIKVYDMKYRQKIG